jgi:hypothetical protein
LPDFFWNKFERISTPKVVTEVMLHREHISLCEPELIVRVAVYQMETGNDTGVTFLHLLNEYVRFAIQARVNNCFYGNVVLSRPHDNVTLPLSYVG